MSKIKSPILLPDNLKRLKDLLDRQYGDQELHNTAYIFVSTVMTADAALFGQVPNLGDIIVVCNILTPILAEYINAGLIDPEKTSAYFEKINDMSPEQIQETIDRVTRKPE